MSTLTGIDTEAALHRRVEELPAPWGDALRAAVRDTMAPSPNSPGHVQIATARAGGGNRAFELRWAKLDTCGAGEPPGRALVLLHASSTGSADTRQPPRKHPESIGAMTAGLVHELANPTTGLSLLVEDLIEHCRDESALRILGQMRELTRRMQQMLSGVKNHATPSASPKAGALIEVRALITSSVELVRLAKREQSPRLETDVQPALYVRGDALQLSQMLINLLNNAIEASPAGAAVHVHAQALRPWVEIRITDAGRGIPPGLVERVFDAFFTTRQEEGGSGLGLALARQIAEGHGGEVHLTSMSGQGTTAIVRLPLAERGTGQDRTGQDRTGQ